MESDQNLKKAIHTKTLPDYSISYQPSMMDCDGGWFEWFFEVMEVEDMAHRLQHISRNLTEKGRLDQR